MKAAVLEGTGKPLVIKAVPDAFAGDHQALVRLKAAALNHRDLWIQHGQYANIKVPAILGSDGSGTVAAVGSDVDGSWLGQEVMINPSVDWGADQRAQGSGFRILGMPDDGTFAEAIAVPVGNLVVRPAHLTMEQAAALPLAGLTAWRALFARGELQAGENVLITGVGGGVALLATQFALAAGATVHVTSGSAEKLKRAQGFGAVGGANYHETDWVAKLRRQAGLFDLVVDSAMGVGLEGLIELTRPGGRIVFYGASAGNPPGLDAREVFFRQISLLGTTMGSPADFAAMVRLVEGRRIVPVIDSTLPLDQADDALRRMETSMQFGKIVLTVGC